MVKILEIGSIELINMEETEKYIVNRLKNGWIIADFRGGFGEHSYFDLLATDFYDDQKNSIDKENHGQDMEIIEDGRIHKTIFGEGERSIAIPTIDSTKLVLIKKNELLSMILGKSKDRIDMINNPGFLFVEFYEGGCANTRIVPDLNKDKEIFEDLTKYVIKRFKGSN